MPQQPFLVGLIGAGIGPSLTPALYMAEAEGPGSGLHLPDDRHRHPGDRPERGGHLGPGGAHPRFRRPQHHSPLQAARGGAPEHAGRTGGSAGRGQHGDLRRARRGRPQHRRQRVRHRLPHRTTRRGSAPGRPARRRRSRGGGRRPLLSHGTAHLVVVDVDVDRATALARALDDRFPTARIDAGRVDQLPVLLPYGDGLVHCTPTGMADHPGLPVDADLLHPGLWVADDRLPAAEYPALRAARRAGCRTLSGGQMARSPGRRHVPPGDPGSAPTSTACSPASPSCSAAKPARPATPVMVTGVARALVRGRHHRLHPGVPGADHPVHLGNHLDSAGSGPPEPFPDPHDRIGPPRYSVRRENSAFAERT